MVSVRAAHTAQPMHHNVWIVRLENTQVSMRRRRVYLGLYSDSVVCCLCMCLLIDCTNAVHLALMHPHLDHGTVSFVLPVIIQLHRQAPRLVLRVLLVPMHQARAMLDVYLAMLVSGQTQTAQSCVPRARLVSINQTKENSAVCHVLSPHTLLAKHRQRV